MNGAGEWVDLDRDPEAECHVVDAIEAGRSMAASSARTVWSAPDLLSADFPEPRWAVPGLIAEGLTLLAGPPKVGKSWLALGLAVAAALGGAALGRLSVEAGDVLYLALEDPPRRLQQRLRMLLAGDGQIVPERLTLLTAWPADGSGFGAVRGWLTDNPGARMVVVDVLARTRRPAVTGQGLYDRDYAAVAEWKAIADDHGVAVVLVHHVRKLAADDYVDTVSGTHGLAGAADSIMVLARSRGSADAKLSLTGRDVEEAEHALAFDATSGTWTLLDGPAGDYEVSRQRRAIALAVRECDGIGPKAIAETTGIAHHTVKHLVRKMLDADQLDTDGAGHYFTVHSVHSVHPDGSTVNGVNRVNGERGDR